MSSRTLLDKVWEFHTVTNLPTGQTQLFIGLHLLHEVTSPQAFDMLREKNWRVLFKDRTFATVDHIAPTDSIARPFKDRMAEIMYGALEKNTKDFGIQLFGMGHENQGIVHILGPETGLTQPGMTIACGDSHTSTHGAFGSLAFGIGTSQVRDVLASGCLAMSKPKVRKIEISGAKQNGVYAKDIILAIIRNLGVNGGVGYAYEYSGETVEKMTMEERMTICNMSIEGGALIGYVNPDQITFDFIKGREFAPKGEKFENAVSYWRSIASDKNAEYDDIFRIDAGTLEPMITWGINPGQSISISELLPDPEKMQDPQNARLAYEHMKLNPKKPIVGTKIDVAFIGSCTNARISDLREAAMIVKNKKIAAGVRGLVVPGSARTKKAAEKTGIDKIFIDAGFEWRNAGCSLCLGMNTDKLQGDELCASSSNRNFIGRQGSPKGRTMLMSPAMVAAAAIEGKITDVRKLKGKK